MKLGSSSRGLGIRNEILVWEPFPFACKRKRKKGVGVASTNGDTLEEPIICVSRSLGPLLYI